METNSVILNGLTPQQQKGVGFLSEFTKRMVLMAFSGQKTAYNASNLIKEVYRVTDQTMAGCYKNGTKPSCKKGCNWCCYLQVLTTPLEVMHIVEYLQTCLSPSEQSILQQRLENEEEFTGGMNGYQKAGKNVACPFVEDGECMVYAVRPLACRAYHSMNMIECKSSYGKDDGSITIRQDISGVATGIFAGLTEGLRAVGLQTSLLELRAGLRIAMDEKGPELAERWLAGEPAFVEAEITNAKKIERFHWGIVEELGKTIQEKI
jgi:Fe-S-cluster containining protein